MTGGRHIVALALALGLGGGAAREAAAWQEPVLMPLPYPDVWGYRLTEKEGEWADGCIVTVDNVTGDVLIRFRKPGPFLVESEFWTDDGPPTSTHFWSFFRQTMAAEHYYPTYDEAKADIELIIPFEIDHVGNLLDDPESTSFGERFTVPMGAPHVPGVAIPGSLGGVGEGAFGTYIIRDDAGRSVAEKAFIWLFNVNRAWPGVERPQMDHCEGIPGGACAIALEFDLYPLRDGTLMGLACGRNWPQLGFFGLAIRFDTRLDSPFLETQPDIRVVDGEEYRRWYAEAEARYPEERGPHIGLREAFMARKALGVPTE